MKNDIGINMTGNSDPLGNAVTEGININITLGNGK